MSCDKPKHAPRMTRLFAWAGQVISLWKAFRWNHRQFGLQQTNQKELIEALSKQLNEERRHVAQLMLLCEVAKKLKLLLDQTAAAQLVVNAIYDAFENKMVAVLTYDREHNELHALAVAGKPESCPPASYHQYASQGMVGRAVRLGETQVSNDTNLDPDYFSLKEQHAGSEIVVPLIFNGLRYGALVIDESNPNAFSTTDVAIAEAYAEQLMNTWERSKYQQRLTELIQAGISLSTMLETKTAVNHIAAIAKNTLEAKYVFVTLLDQEGNLSITAWAGEPCALFEKLKDNPKEQPLIHSVLNATQPLRLRDMHCYQPAARLKSETKDMHNLLAFPICLHDISIGAIICFEKQGEAFFTASDESLARQVSSQAAGAIESTWLYQELQLSLQTVTLLYQLSTRITQSGKIYQAAEAIAETAFRLGRALVTGIVLFTPEGRIQAQVEHDASGSHPGEYFPKQLVEQAMASSQIVIYSDDNINWQVCIPLLTERRKFGVLWLHISEGQWHRSRYMENLQTLANQATIALERANLLTETRKKTNQIKSAFQELESTYDQTLAALTSALDARDRETEGHSIKVARIARMLGDSMGLSPQQLKALERGALLHDIGKIGISDVILHKPGALNSREWDIMRQHPNIGAKIVEGIPFLLESVAVVRHHHERLDGSGYPSGLKETDIPLSARIFAVADVFDAMTSMRPYRRRISVRKTMQYLNKQAGILFDAKIVSLLDEATKSGRISEILS